MAKKSCGGEDLASSDRNRWFCTVIRKQVIREPESGFSTWRQSAARWCLLVKKGPEILIEFRGSAGNLAPLAPKFCLATMLSLGLAPY